jgi:hypothetical protein
MLLMLLLLLLLLLMLLLLRMLMPRRSRAFARSRRFTAKISRSPETFGAFARALRLL